jgi:quercetin dioxygenase-like cupin family protein
MTDPMNSEHVLQGGEPQLLTQMVDYMPHGIISRSLLKKPTGNITLFAFDRGEGLNEHTAPFDALIYMLEGKAEVFVGEKRSEGSEDDVILLPAGVPHSVRALSPFKMMLILIRS